MEDRLFLLKLKKGLFVCSVVLILLFSYIKDADAQHLHLGGSIDLSYSKLSTIQNNDKSETTTFQQRYNLRGFGDIVDPRLGTYSGNISFLEDVIDNSGVSEKNRFKIRDGSLSINLLPRKTPLRLFVQRIKRDNKLFTSTSSTSTTYNISWDIPLRRMPRLRLNLYQVDVTSDESIVQSDTRNRAASIETSGRIGETRIVTKYQFSSFDVEDTGSTKSSSYNLNVDTQLTTSLSARGYGNYSTRTSSLGSAIPGVSFFRENSGGMSLSYRPSRLVKGNVSYDYFQNPSESFNKFKRHVFNSNINVRPNQKADIFGSYRFLLFDSTLTRSDSHFGSMGVNYRPIFGMITGLTASYGLTNTNGLLDTKSIFQNYRYFISYIKTLRRVHLNSSYNISYGTNRTEPANVSSTDLINSISFGIDNTDVRFVHGRASYTFNDIRRTITVAINEDQQEHRLALSADSNYFRNILLHGDNLLLQSNASYSNIRGFGAVGNTILFDLNTTYYLWRGLIFSTGYSLQDFPKKFLEDRQTIFGEGQWLTYPLRNVSIDMKVRETYEDNRFSNDRKLFEASSFVYYRLGKVLMSLEYRKSREEKSRVVTEIDAVYVRANRSF
ncbi:MAG: hypothetical protein ACE5EA_03430 [Nitrospirota bacterium]